MKRLNLAVAILLSLFVLPVVFTTASAAPQRERGQIIRADYGFGNYWADVTQRLGSMVRGDGLNFRVDSMSLGIDPAPRQPKILRLEIRHRDGSVEQQTYQEREFVHLRGYSVINTSFNGLQIFRGVYGDGRRQMDVTDRLNSQIQDGQLNTQVTSENLGGDPAPGRPKTLTIQYSLNGSSEQLVLNEGDFLNLPVDDRRDVGNRDRDRGPGPGPGPQAGPGPGPMDQPPPNGPGPDDRPREGYRTIPAGSRVAIRTNEAIDSTKSGAGQTFSASIAENVVSDRGRVLIPKGSDVTLIIRSTSGYSLVLDIDSVIVDGVQYGVSTEDLQKGHQGLGANQRTAQMVGGGAVLGAIIGGIAGGGKGAAIGAGVGAAAGAGTEVATQGKNVRVPAEAVMNFTLDNDLHLERRQR